MKRAVIFSTALGLVAGCGSASTSPVAPDAAATTAACPTTSPACPAVAPSYASEVRSILLADCATCHHPGSTLARSSLVTYADVDLVSGSAFGQVESCLMPPGGQPQLTAGERTTILEWFACGAPDN